MSISSSAYYNVSTSSSNGGISGLVSGIDTDTLVSEMLSGIQAKIDAQYGTQTQTEWKQQLYRDVIADINEFKNTYFDTSYGSSLTNNLSSSTFFDNLYSTVTGSSAVSVVSTSSSASLAESYDIAVKQLASSASLSTGYSLSGDNTLTGSALTDDQLDLFNSPAELILNVNGTDVSIDLAGVSKMSEVEERITSALADQGIEGVTVSSSTAGLSIEAEDGTTIEVDRDNSDLLAIQYSGLTETDSTTETEDGVTTISGTTGDFISNVTSFTLTFDGVSKLITLNSVQGTGTDGAITVDDVALALNNEVNEAFGGYVQARATEDGGLEFFLHDDYASEQGHEIKVTGSNALNLGFDPGQSSSFDTTQTLEELGITNYDFTINGVDFSFDADTTISSVMSAINNSDAGVSISYSSISDSIKMTTTSTGAMYGIDIEEGDGGILSRLFYGSNGGTLDGDSNTIFTDGYTEAVDAIIEVNGIETSRSSNTFTIDGITMTLNHVSESSLVETTVWEEQFVGMVNGVPQFEKVEVTVEETVYDTSNITNARNEDAIVEGIASFINDYNALIEKLNALIDADSTYKDYPPLTDAQKSEMTESQIELWEESGKEGLLRNDTYVSSFLSSMRSSLYQSCGDSGLAIYQIGITTSSDYKDKGMLIFDEAAFRSALSSDPDAIKDLFTNTTNGLSATLTTIMNNVANESSGSPGVLTSLVGVEGYSSESNNTYTSKLSSISSRITQLEYQYSLQKERYWSQFTSMETILNSYSTSMSLFTDYFA